MTADVTTSSALDVADRAGVFVSIDADEGPFDVHVVVDGDPADPAVVCVHGVPGSTRDFRHFAAAASSLGLCVVRLDLPGFGRSPRSPSSTWTTPEARARLVHAVMLARGHRRFAVVGHSFGGTTALATAALFPSAVTSLALVNSVGITRHRGLVVPHELFRPVKHLGQVPVVGERLRDVMVATYARMGIKSDKPLEVDDVVAHTSIVGGLDFKDLRAFASAIVCPALVVSADDDGLVEATVSQTLAAALSSSPLVTHRKLKTGGHFLQKRDADAVASWMAARIAPADTASRTAGAARPARPRSVGSR